MTNPRPKKSKPVTLDDRRPSTVTDAYWLRAEKKSGEYPEHTDRGGKWLIFVASGRDRRGLGKNQESNGERNSGWLLQSGNGETESECGQSENESDLRLH